MNYELHNPSTATRIIYDAQNQPVKMNPGARLKHISLDDAAVRRLRASKIGVTEEDAAGSPITSKRVIRITGHRGIGDNLHQRGPVRELLRRGHDVYVDTPGWMVYHDLVQEGLKLCFMDTALHAQARQIERERGTFRWHSPPVGKYEHKKIFYNKEQIDRFGSIVEAMYGVLDLPTDNVDFSMPVPDSWRQLAKNRLNNPSGKPVMVYRPITLRREWDGSLRNPDPSAYHALIRSVADKFHVVSVAHLKVGVEWAIDGTDAYGDQKFHAGELNFPELAGLWAEADMVFASAGFAPVLAQAVGTPVAVVYGGRESFRTTDRGGSNLAPTLGIDPDRPCDCHLHRHTCADTKHITLGPALDRLQSFVGDHVGKGKPVEVRAAPKKTLIFGTVYEDEPGRAKLTDTWVKFHSRLNPGADLLLVDSASPYRPTILERNGGAVRVFDFGDNIGHLSRRGRDGWGRAFCKGLEIAAEEGYDYVAHVEGDSLLRIPVNSIVEEMKERGDKCLTTIVKGMRFDHANWVETGLMIFSVPYLRESNFVGRYNWPMRRVAPTPEAVIYSMIRRDIRLMDWKALRGDKNQITHSNIRELDLDWVTHCHNDTWAYDKFAEANGLQLEPVVEEPEPVQSSLLKLNLGCGTNKLKDWTNHDADVDITKTLPWPNNSASHISIEHCVEHVPYKSAVDFFKEAHRVLSPGGILRVTIPSLEQIAACNEEDYYKFTQKWQRIGPTKRGAMHAIIYAHGHEMVWNAKMMQDTLYFAGFDDVKECKPGESEDPVLRGVEGHGHVIGDKFNAIESCVHEARKGTASRPRIAVVVGGAECWEDDLNELKKLAGSAELVMYVVNDHIEDVPGSVVACTLHIDKLSSWLSARAKNGHTPPTHVWGFRRDRQGHVTHQMRDLGGSTSLFAVMAAKEDGFTKVVTCGCPMTHSGNHYKRHARWNTAQVFWEKWIQNRSSIGPWFKSMSGRPAEMFGKPTEEWLKS